jgi:hypothetical protein
MSTDFKLTLHPDYIHVELAPGDEIRPASSSAVATPRCAGWGWGKARAFNNPMQGSAACAEETGG